MNVDCRAHGWQQSPRELQSRACGSTASAGEAAAPTSLSPTSPPHPAGTPHPTHHHTCGQGGGDGKPGLATRQGRRPQRRTATPCSRRVRGGHSKARAGRPAGQTPSPRSRSAVVSARWPSFKPGIGSPAGQAPSPAALLKVRSALVAATRYRPPLATAVSRPDWLMPRG